MGCICAYVHMYLCVYACMHACMCVCVCVCVCVTCAASSGGQAFVALTNIATSGSVSALRPTCCGVLRRRGAQVYEFFFICYTYAPTRRSLFFICYTTHDPLHARTLHGRGYRAQRVCLRHNTYTRHGVPGHDGDEAPEAEHGQSRACVRRAPCRRS